MPFCLLGAPRLLGAPPPLGVPPPLGGCPGPPALAASDLSRPVLPAALYVLKSALISPTLPPRLFLPLMCVQAHLDSSEVHANNVTLDAYLFAPPNAGDATFAEAFNRRVNARRLPFIYDLIPQVKSVPAMPAATHRMPAAARAMHALVTPRHIAEV